MGRIQKLFTDPKSWKGKNSFINNIFDPGGMVLKMEETTPREKAPVDPAATAEDAANRERERRRIATGSATTYASRKTNALSASIGKRFLGGTS